MISSNRTKIRWTAVLAFIAGISVWSFSQCQFENGPVGESCINSVYLCGDKLHGYFSRLPEKHDHPWTSLCDGNGNIDNITWISFTPCGSKVTLEITPSNCTTVTGAISGIQAAIYDQCDSTGCLAFIRDRGIENGMIEAFQISASGVTPGNPLYLCIDGFSGSA